MVATSLAAGPSSSGFFSVGHLCQIGAQPVCRFAQIAANNLPANDQCAYFALGDFRQKALQAKVDAGGLSKHLSQQRALLSPDDLYAPDQNCLP